MKQLGAIAFLVALISGGTLTPALGATDTSTLGADLRRANEMVLAGELDHGIQIYRSLLERGVESPDVYFNLGVAHAHHGEPVLAIVAYERALWRAPNDEGARTNLVELKKELLGPEEATRAPSSAAEWLDPWVAAVPVEGSGIAAVIANACLFALLISRRSAMRARWRQVTTVSAVLAASALTGALVSLAAHGIVWADHRGVVTESASARAGPHERYDPVGDLVAGERVRIRDLGEAWVEVESVRGVRGFVPRRRVADVRAPLDPREGD